MRKTLKMIGTTALVVGVLAVVAGAVLFAKGMLYPAMVVTGSMDAPGGVPVGSLALGWRTDHVAVGDVVTGTSSLGTRVTHRVIQVLEDGTYRMRGDANEAADAKPYAIDDPTYRVVAVIPYAGFAVAGVQEHELGRTIFYCGVGSLVTWGLLHPTKGRGRHRASADAREDASVTTSPLATGA